jgi:hypothetical protein
MWRWGREYRQLPVDPVRGAIYGAGGQAGREHDAALAALFLALQAYAELTYASFLMIFAGWRHLWGLCGCCGASCQMPGLS